MMIMMMMIMVADEYDEDISLHRDSDFDEMMITVSMKTILSITLN